MYSSIQKDGVSMNDVVKYRRGDLWWFRTVSKYDNPERGVLAGSRPILIISVVSNPNSFCTVSYVPISHAKSAQAKEKTNDYYLVKFQMPDCVEASYACCNQISTTTTAHLRGYIGHMSDEMLSNVETRLKQYLGMIPCSEVPMIEAEGIELLADSDPDITIVEQNENLPAVSETSKKHRSKRCKYRCVETEEVFNTLKEVGKYINMSAASARRYIDTNRPAPCGLHFISYE